MSKYRIRFDGMGRTDLYFKLQERRWWGWKTLGFGSLEQMEKNLKQLNEFEARKEAAP